MTDTPTIHHTTTLTLSILLIGGVLVGQSVLLTGFKSLTAWIVGFSLIIVFILDTNYRNRNLSPSTPE